MLSNNHCRSLKNNAINNYCYKIHLLLIGDNTAGFNNCLHRNEDCFTY